MLFDSKRVKCQYHRDSPSWANVGLYAVSALRQMIANQNPEIKESSVGPTDQLLMSLQTTNNSQIVASLNGSMLSSVA
jgi:hypothetical protein